MNILTGNDLKTGTVLWWTSTGWGRDITQALDVGDNGADLGKSEERAQKINSPYVVAAHQTPQGPVPHHIKERIRAAGPSIRPDLGIKTPFGPTG